MHPPVVASLLLALAVALVPASAAARDGALIVRSSPSGADVVVDGTSVGEAPRTVPLPAGKHTITLKLKGYLSDSQSVVVKPGQTAKLYVRLTKAGVEGLRLRDSLEGTPPPGLGIVVVTTEPAGLRVFVNGERVERPTPVAFDIGPGTYAIVLKLKDKDAELFSTSVEVKEGERAQVKRNLRQAVEAARAGAGADQGRPGVEDADGPRPGAGRKPAKCTCTPRKKLQACVERKRACKLGAPDGERGGGYALCYSCPQFRRLAKKRKGAAETACDTRTGRTDDCVCRDIARVVTQCLAPQDSCLKRCGRD